MVNSFISRFRFLFHLEFKFKDKPFRAYRGQWDISIILPKTSVFLGFHYWQSMKVRYVVLGAPRDLIGRCLFRCQLLLERWDCYFIFIGSQWNISRSRFISCFFCANFVKNLLSRGILGLLGLNNFIWYFFDSLWYLSRP